MTDTESSFEESFQQYTWLAHQLPDILETLSPGRADSEDYPHVTAARLHLAVRPLYHAAILALGRPEAAIGSLALMRPLVEAWSHLFFIRYGDGKASADREALRCRALQFEFGMATTRTAMYQALRSDAFAPELEAAQKQQSQLERLKGEAGCSGKRDQGNVAPTLKNMAQKMAEKYGDISWLEGAWKSMSEVAHAMGWDRQLSVLPDGRAVVADPGHGLRASWLRHLVVIYASLAETFLELVDTESNIGPLWTAAKQILDDPWLTGVIDEP
jgi:hypothetical protein